MEQPLVVDGPDRVAAGLYALAVAVGSVAAAFLSTPQLFGPLAWWWPLLVAAALAGLLVQIPIRRRAPAAAVMVVGFWLADGSWVAYGCAHGIGHGKYWAVWIVGSLLLIAAAATMATPSDFGLPMHPAPPAGATAPVVVPATREGEWEQRLATVGKAPGASVAPIVDWPTGAGYDVDAELPDGVVWEDVKARERHISGTLKLGPGCGAEVWPGAHTGAARITVTTLDTLAEPRTYTDTSELTGTGLIPVGWYRDNRPVLIPVREDCILCISATGGGKTGFLHALTAGHVRCPDVLVWHIDLGGAGLALPWARPYLRGDIRRPVVDWYAADLDEALWMTEFALQVIKGRRAAHGDMMADADATILPISPRIPAIRIVVDETAEAAGMSADPRLTQNIIRIIQLGRAMAVRMDLSGLAAIATVLPTDAQRQIGTRALFAVNDEAEIGRALGWHTKLRLDSIRHKGGGRIRIGAAGPVDAFRTERADQPSTIAAIAAACVDRRPTLGEVAHPRGPLAHLPLRDVYLSRWDRAGSRAGGPPVSQGEPPAHGPRTPPGSPAAHPTRPTSLVDTIHAAADEAVRAVGRAKHLGRVDFDGEWRRLSGELETDVLRGAADTTMGADGDGDPERGGQLPADNRAAALAVLRRFGADGASGTAVHAALVAAGRQVSLSRVYDYLNDGAARLRHGAYVHPDLRSDP